MKSRIIGSISFSSAEQVRMPVNSHRWTELPKYIIMEVDIIELATHCPDVTISVKASDMLAFGRAITEDLLTSLRKAGQDSSVTDGDTLLTREEAMKLLRISAATIWRWKKCGYLIPVRVGSMDRYRLSDINGILKAKGGER